MDKVAREKTRVKIKDIFRFNILPKTYIVLGFALLLIIIGNFSPFIINDISDTLSIPLRYIEVFIRVPLLLIGIFVIQIFISFYQIIKLVLFGEKIIPFNDLNLKENLFNYKGKEYSGEAFIEKNNIITDEFIFEKGRKISHIKIRDEFGNIEFAEQWYYESINPHPKGVYEPLGEDGAAYEVSSKRIIVNKYKTWHKNRQLAQRYITYKNGKELEIRFDENGNEII
tara:strand:- start:127 stop:807 length:681 start_codon:yes stop_codon:yes gene_type:complete